MPDTPLSAFGTDNGVCYVFCFCGAAPANALLYGPGGAAVWAAALRPSKAVVEPPIRAEHPAPCGVIPGGKCYAAGPIKKVNVYCRVWL